MLHFLLRSCLQSVSLIQLRPPVQALAVVNVPAFHLDILITIQEGLAGLEIRVVDVSLSTTPILSFGSSWIEKQTVYQEKPEELFHHHYSVLLLFIAVKNAGHYKQEAAQRQDNRVDQGQDSGFQLIGQQKSNGLNWHSPLFEKQVKTELIRSKSAIHAPAKAGPSEKRMGNPPESMPHARYDAYVSEKKDGLGPLAKRGVNSDSQSASHFRGSQLEK